MQLRRLNYQRKGFRKQAVLTSLLDPNKYPATKVVAAYHERWEVELGFDEVKTERLEQKESLRSQRVEAVEQEAWGVLLAYNLVRQEMVRLGSYAECSRIGSASPER
jgi:IS4 transposase